MASKQKILDALAACPLDVPPLPAVDQAWTTYDDPCRQLTDVLAAVGGQAVVVQNIGALEAALARIEAFRLAQHVCALVPGVGGATVDPRTESDPHALRNVDFAILPGVFAVAENGAVWVTDEVVCHRAVFYLAEHVALVVPRHEIVHNMHQAYARLTLGNGHFGAFISGPSKTADIEQSLVIGAQGPRSLTLFLVES